MNKINYDSWNKLKLSYYLKRRRKRIARYFDEYTKRNLSLIGSELFTNVERKGIKLKWIKWVKEDQQC
jgi:hypothetical protein